MSWAKWEITSSPNRFKTSIRAFRVLLLIEDLKQALDAVHRQSQENRVQSTPNKTRLSMLCCEYRFHSWDQSPVFVRMLTHRLWHPHAIRGWASSPEAQVMFKQVLTRKTIIKPQREASVHCALIYIQAGSFGFLKVVNFSGIISNIMIFLVLSRASWPLLPSAQASSVTLGCSTDCSQLSLWSHVRNMWLEHY